MKILRQIILITFLINLLSCKRQPVELVYEYSWEGTNEWVDGYVYKDGERTIGNGYGLDEILTNDSGFIYKQEDVYNICDKDSNNIFEESFIEYDFPVLNNKNNFFLGKTSDEEDLDGLFLYSINEKKRIFDTLFYSILNLDGVISLQGTGLYEYVLLPNNFNFEFVRNKLRNYDTYIDKKSLVEVSKINGHTIFLVRQSAEELKNRTNFSVPKNIKDLKVKMPSNDYKEFIRSACAKKSIYSNLMEKPLTFSNKYNLSSKHINSVVKIFEFDKSGNLGFIMQNEKNQYGVFNEKGEPLIPFQKDKLKFLLSKNDKIFLSKKLDQGKNYVIDEHGEIIMDKKFSFIDTVNIDNTYYLKARNSENEKIALVKLDGRVEKEFEYDFMETKLNSFIALNKRSSKSAELILKNKTILRIDNKGRIALSSINKEHVFVKLETPKYSAEFVVSKKGEVFLPNHYKEILFNDKVLLIK